MSVSGAGAARRLPRSCLRRRGLSAERGETPPSRRAPALPPARRPRGPRHPPYSGVRGGCPRVGQRSESPGVSRRPACTAGGSRSKAPGQAGVAFWVPPHRLEVRLLGNSRLFGLGVVWALFFSLFCVCASDLFKTVAVRRSSGGSDPGSTRSTRRTDFRARLTLGKVCANSEELPFPAGSLGDRREDGRAARSHSTAGIAPACRPGRPRPPPQLLSCASPSQRAEGNPVRALGSTPMFPVGEAPSSPPRLPLPATTGGRLVLHQPQCSFCPRCRVSASEGSGRGLNSAGTKSVL